MSLFTIILAVNLSTFLLSFDAAEAKVTTIAEASTFFSKNALAFDVHSFENDTFLYAECDLSHNVTEKNYTVILSRGSLVPIHQCNVTLRTTIKNRVIGSYVHLRLLGKDKAVVSWVETDPTRSSESPRKLRFAILKMANDCQVSEAKIDLSEMDSLFVDNMRIITYENTFDVFLLRMFDHFYNHPETELYKVTINEEGKILSDKRFCNNTKYLIEHTVATHSSADGFIAFYNINLYTHSTGPVAYIGTDGNITDFKNPSDAAPFVSSSNSYGLSTCYVKTEKGPKPIAITCIQYDRKTFEVKLQSNFTFDYRPTTDMAVLQNRPEGYLLMLPERKLINGTASDIIQHYYVYKFSKQKSEALILEGPSCDIGKAFSSGQFYMNDKGQQCLTLVCFNSTNKGNQGLLKFAIFCFDDDDFDTSTG